MVWYVGFLAVAVSASLPSTGHHNRLTTQLRAAIIHRLSSQKARRCWLVLCLGFLASALCWLGASALFQLSFMPLGFLGVGKCPM